jgi:hypothetical protein
MTPEQAKTKWCPMVRCGSAKPDDGIEPDNSTLQDRTPVYARCVGADCALWRDYGHQDGECGLIVRYNDYRPI